MQNNFLYHKSCNFCKSKKRKILFKIGEQKLYKCINCNLVYFDKQRKDLENLYEEKYYLTDEGNVTANYADYKIQEKTILRDFSFAFNYLAKKGNNKKKRLLEIGPGYGYFLKHLPSTILGEGIEVSHDAVMHMKKAGLTVYEGDFIQMDLNHKYDFIVAFDVVEHQLYLKEFFEKVNMLLKPNGTFTFTTPDYDSLLNKLFKKNAPTIQPLYHNYYLTQLWLRQNLAKLGFKIIHLKTVYLTYISIGQIIIMASFAFPSTKSLGLSKLVRIFKLENVLIPFFRFGGIECIIQKV